MPKRSATSAEPLTPLIVGIGSSAGESEAFLELIAGLGRAPGAAIVCVQHPDPQGRSLQVDRLSNHSSMRVVEIAGRKQLKENTVYVCRAEQRIKLQSGFVDIMQSDDDVPANSTLDHLFLSIARDQGDRGIGVLLSGISSDGTLGLNAISECGGLTFVQCPSSAKHDAEAHSAVISEVADHVATPREIAAELMSHVRYQKEFHTTLTDGQRGHEIRQAIPVITDALLKETNHNFAHYKANTLIRRIQRRMHVLKLTSVSDYVDHLRNDKDEAQSLFWELLIGVTMFFRDPDAFESLKQKVLPTLFAQRSARDPVRIWVAGCANGAEAYTVAMLCCEVMDTIDIESEVRIFATDIDERALKTARAGSYPAGIEEHVSPERLERFFVKRGKRYQVGKELRDRVLFSTHNLISDPPFSRQDLITCRNLLIYLGPRLQNKLFALFHYALRPGGYLFLGSSENITSHAELFRPVDAKQRISQRQETAARKTPSLSPGQVHGARWGSRQSATEHPADLTAIAGQLVLEEFGPKYAIIDESGQILNSSADLEKYVPFQGGDYHNNIIRMVHSALRIGLRSTLHEAIKSKRKVQHDRLSIRVGQRIQRMMLTVQPMPQRADGESLYMIVFHEIGLPVARDDFDKPDAQTDNDAESLIMQLERELDATRHDLDKSMQDMEAANEELKSSNEELLSMNEELQSANEELESSKDEIRVGSRAVERMNTDLENLLRSTQIATVFLDSRKMVQWYSPAACSIYNLIETDLGRPLRHITHNALDMPPIPHIDGVPANNAASASPNVTDAAAAQNSLASAMASNRFPEHEVQLEDGRWFLRRVLPFLRDEQVDGTILTFMDVTDQKRAAIRLETEHRVTRVLADADSFWNVVAEVLEAIRHTLKADFCALWLVEAYADVMYCAHCSIPSTDAELQALSEVKSHIRFAKSEGLPGRVWESRKPEWIVDLSQDPGFVRNRVVEAGLRSGMAMPIVVGSKFYGVIEIFTKVRLQKDPLTFDMLQSIGTEIGQFIKRRDLDERLRDQEARKSAIMAASLDAIITMDSEGRIVDFNPAAEQAFGISSREVIGQPLVETIVPPEFRDRHRDGLARYLQTGESKVIGQRIELTALRTDGNEFPVELAINAATTRDGRPFFTAHVRDITVHKQFVKAIQDRDEQIVTLLNSTAEGIYGIDLDGNCTFANASCVRLLGCDSADQLVGRQMHNLIHHSHADGSVYPERECRIFESYRAGERVHADDEVFWRQDGTPFDAEYWSYPLLRDKKIIGCVVTFLDVTERRRWQRELVDREAHLRRVINNQLGLVGVIDRNGILLEVDDRSLKIARTRREDVIGKHFADAPWWNYDPNVAQQMRDAMQRAYNGEAVRYDVSLFAHGEEGVMIDFMIAPVKKDDGEVEYLIPSGVDITERKAAEIALEQRAKLAELHTTLAIELARGNSLNRTLQAACQQFVNVLNVAFARVWLYDEKESVLRLTAGAGMYTHLDGGHAIIPMGSFKIGRIGQQQEPLLTNDVANDPNISDPDWAIREGMTAFAGYPLVISGRTVGVLAMFSRQKVSAVEFEQMGPMSVAVAQCIDRMQYAIKLAENAKRMEMSVHAGNMAAWEWTKSKSYWDLKLFELLGVEPVDEPTPEFFFSCVHPEDLPGLQATWNKATSGEDIYKSEFRIIRPDGQIRWLAAVGIVTQGEDGRIATMHGLNWDVTEQHEYQQNLDIARQQAEAANEAKSAFVANMSHEIRTPMTAILGYAELIRDRITDPETLEHLRTIRRNGDYLLEIINDILDLSKIEAGKLEISSEKFDPADVVEDVRAFMEVRAAENDLQLKVDYGTQIPARIDSDPKRLKQILINLVGNAIKFTRKGSVTIAVRYTGNGKLEFEITDTGIGIGDEQQQTLFTPFSQGDASVSRNFGGTGLGLAISRRLTEMLGGTISVISQQGSGSTFTVTIPTGTVTRIDLVRPAPKSAENVDHEGSAVTSVRLDCHVLVVDDRRDVRFLSKHILTRAGATVEEAEDGQLAVDHVARSLNDSNRPDLVLLDMQMPNLDGYETARQLRTIGYTGPIIALTADAMQGDMNRCLESGCNDYLSKPIDTHALTTMVHRFTTGTQSQ